MSDIDKRAEAVMAALAGLDHFDRASALYHLLGVSENKAENGSDDLLVEIEKAVAWVVDFNDRHKSA